MNKALPFLEEARRQVQALNRVELDFLGRQKDEPPQSVRRTIEMVHLLLHCCSVNVDAKIEWATCCLLLRRQDLLTSIYEFDTEILVDEFLVVDFIDIEYLGPHPSFPCCLGLCARG